MSNGRDAAIAVALIGAVSSVIAAAIQAGVFSDSGSSGDATARKDVAVDVRNNADRSPFPGSTQSITLPPVLPPPPENVETSLFLNRDSGPTGTTVMVSGEGFLPNERVEIRLHTDRLALTRANASGRFSGVSVVIPDSFAVFAPRAFEMRAVGERSIRSASTNFTVSG